MKFVSAIILLLFIAFVVVAVTGAWKTYGKAGKPGWAVVVPFYNSWVLAEIAGRPGWWGLYPFLGFVPLLGPFAAIIIAAVIAVDVAHKFGKSTAFGLFYLWLFLPIGNMILGFGSAQYDSGSKPHATSKTRKSK